MHNKGGVAGALFADGFYYLFGYCAYLFPIMVGYIAWLIRQQEYKVIFAKPHLIIMLNIGFLLVLSAGCGPLAIYFSPDNMLFNYGSGGILGHLVSENLQNLFNQLVTTILLLSLFLLGTILLIHQSWLKLIYRAFTNRNR
ncbi:DNA translocase FtsK 4TM domain-containing protein [Candidatus Albibeggiatoa sp. nov. BB20]|uniref:DNA translocase FtsK 4TM domain-containing protein n=1 Tax=Candidatus Albibeggiatoa sp. nov. BB20 TaxID=3162723 RepID=UPI0033659857